MQLSRFSKTWRGVAAAVVIAAGGAAFAEDFPTRPLQHFYPWPAKGATFAASQIIADAMSDELGQKMQVVSRPGAGGLTAFKAAMAEPSDGYTTIDGYIAPLVIAPLNGKADYTYEDFIPLHFAMSNTFAIVARADDDRFDDLASMLEYIKANPGKTRYSGGPDQALPHLIAASLMKSNDAVSRYIPYNGTIDGVKDLRSGVLDWAVALPGMYRANEDHLKVIAVLGDSDAAKAWYGGAKSAQDDGFDAGLSGLGQVGWTWWLAPKGTPDAEVQILRDAMAAALAKEEVREKVQNLGFVLDGFTYDQYAEKVGPVADQLIAAKAAVEWEKEAIKNLN